MCKETNFGRDSTILTNTYKIWLGCYQITKDMCTITDTKSILSELFYNIRITPPSNLLRSFAFRYFTVFIILKFYSIRM